MKRLFAILAILISTIAVNAQSNSFSLFPKSAVKTKPRNFVCNCSTNHLLPLLKSKANADWFQKMTKLSVDTIQYKPSTVPVYANIPVTNLPQLLNINAVANPDRMPIAKLTNTDKRMPIVKTDRTGYNMPIVGKSKVIGYAIYKTKSGADSVVAF
ncbi:hypothetical protein [Mucilaginibacter sp. UYCu711]|uniref:hypothetical protein n=1 Tax=Mucilaginibacter sp. UYCu711 TaxID=3156339 RepID=UPI003D24126D